MHKWLVFVWLTIALVHGLGWQLELAKFILADSSV